MPVKSLTYEVQPADAGRLDALVARLAGLSRAQVRGLIDHGGVTLDGVGCENPATPVGAGMLVGVRFDPERRYREKPRARATHGFTVVYADDHLVVVDKHAGLLTVPTPRGESNTLIDRLSAHLSQGRPGRRQVSVVHRLDRETSGLLVFGRSKDVTQSLIAQFAAHKPEREYVALVRGRVAADGGTIRSHLVTDKALNQKSVRGPGAERGELAVTHYEVRTRYADATLVAVRLETGRRNQIRVHFSEQGHPVLGDRRYRPDQAAHPAWPYDRLALHARVLGFRHPVERRDLRFEAEVPAEFGAFARKVKQSP